MSMFCFQCQETAKNQGCTVRGVCGKTEDVARLQDLLIWLLKGLSFYGVKARELGVSDPEADLFVAQSLFATITNANFDPQRFVKLIHEALDLRDDLGRRFQRAYQETHGQAFSGSTPEAATWAPQRGDVDELIAKGATVGVMSDPDLDEDIRSLRDELGTLNAIQVVRPDGQMQSMLFQRCNGDDHHVGTREQVTNFRRSHMRQIVLNLRLVPDRVFLRSNFSAQHKQRHCK